MNDDQPDSPIQFAPPVPVKGPNGEEFFLRQAYAVISPQEAGNIAKQVAAFIASALAAALGSQLVPMKPEGVVGETKVEPTAGP